MSTSLMSSTKASGICTLEITTTASRVLPRTSLSKTKLFKTAMLLMAVLTTQKTQYQVGVSATAVMTLDTADAVTGRTVREVLDFNVKLYCLADYLDVAGLQSLALTNCTSILKEATDYASLIDPIAHALENTNPNDAGLRPQIIRFCSQQDSIEQCAELVAVLRAAEPVAWTLQVEAFEEQKKLAENVGIAENTLQDDALQAAVRCEDLTNRLERTEKKKDEVTGHYNTAIDLLHKYRECRNYNCPNEFGATIYHSEPGVLRCKRCKCRHVM